MTTILPSRSGRAWCFLSVALGVTLLLRAPVWALPPAPTPLEISVHDLGIDPGHFDRDVARLRQVVTTFHAKSFKFDTGWDMVEPREGMYDFSRADYMCRVAKAVGIKVKLIANNGWSVPRWLWTHKDQEPFALNADGQTGRQGQTVGSDLGRYPAPVLLSYANPWVRRKIAAWQGALARHVEHAFPGLVNAYICEGEIYLNPDNDTGTLLFDYNPWTIRLFRTWLKSDSSSPYCGSPEPGQAAKTGLRSLNQRWQAQYAQWDDVQPPRVLKAGDAATRDWCAFLQWYVAWSYQQVASGLRAQTRLPITFLFNTFTGVPMPNDHVWGPSRTQDEYWRVFQMAAPYVTTLGVTAYPYDPGWDVDASGQWDTSMAFLSTCSRLLHRPIQITEGGGTTMHVRTMTDLRWQLFSAYSHNLLALDLGYIDLPDGVSRTYSWNPAFDFPDTQTLCRSYASIPRAGAIPAPRIAVLYDSEGEWLAPGDGTEAHCVRAVGRWLRNAHYPFDVLDMQALDQGVVSLQNYRAVFLPSGVSLSAASRQALTRYGRAGGLLFLGDRAGFCNSWGEPAKPLRDQLGGTHTVRLDSAALAAEQTRVEQTGTAPEQKPVWLGIVRKTLRPAIEADPFVDMSLRRPLIVFNRSAEQTASVTLPGHASADLPPGQEWPRQAIPLPPEPSDTPPPLDDPQSWTVYGLFRPGVSRAPDGGTTFDFPANPGPPLDAEIGCRHAIGGLEHCAALTFSWKGDAANDPATAVRLLLRLVSTQTGRAYEVLLPYPTADTKILSFRLAEDFKIPSARRLDLDRLELAVAGYKAWPRLVLTLGAWQFQKEGPLARRPTQETLPSSHVLLLGDPL